MSTPRPTRIRAIDRPWVGMRSVLLATPLQGLSVERAKAMLAGFMAADPAAPYAGRLDGAGRRWVPVPERERAAHVDRVLVAVPDPVDGLVAEHVARYLPTVDADLPFVAFVGERSLMLVASHALGDALSSTRLVYALSRADAGALHGLLRMRTGATGVSAALLRQLREHRAEWLTYVRNPSRPPGPPADLASTYTRARPAFAGAVLDNAAVKDITRWRNANAKGVSLASVLTTAAYGALVEAGVRLDGSGYYGLFDVRSYLPDLGERRYGNLGKSLYLSADLADPTAVAAAMGVAQQTRRVLPAMVVGAATSLLPTRPAGVRAHPDAAPAVLTFNMLPSLPGLDELPWADDRSRRYFGFGASNGPGDISVIALRMRDHMQLTASFDEATAAPELVQAALESLTSALIRA